MSFTDLIMSRKGVVMTRNVIRGIGFSIAITILLSTIPAALYADQLTVTARRDTVFKGAEAGYWGVKLRFNHLVFPSNLAESLLVTVDGVQKDFQIKTPNFATIATRPAREFLIVPLKTGKRPQTIDILVEKALSDASGRRLLAENFTYRFISVQKIHVSNISTFYRSKKDRGLTLDTSDNVKLKDLTRALEIDPKVPNLNVSASHSRHFRITGDFDYNQDYVLKVTPKNIDSGTAVLVAKEFSFKGPGLKSEISPRSQRSVVELLGRQLFPLTISNVTKIQCKLKRVPPFLLPEVAPILSKKSVMEGPGWIKQFAELKSLADRGKIHPVFVGDYYEESETFFAPEAREHVYGYSLPFSFRKNPERGGAWIVILDDPDSGFSRQLEHPIQITDLSLSYKYSPESLLIWVTSIHSGQPVPNVEVMLHQHNGTRYFVGKTNTDGVIAIKDGEEFSAIGAKDLSAGTSKQPVVLSSVSWAVAATDTDSCGIDLGSLRLKPFAVTQTKSTKEQPDYMKGNIFTERGVYRAAETVHFKIVSRIYKDNRITSPAGEKLKVEIIGPRRDTHYSKELTIGEFGSCYDSFPTKKFFPVGTYTIKAKPVKPSSSNQVFSSTFMIQDYKRARHYATVSFKRGKRQSNAYVGLKREEEFLDVAVAGSYYVGGPVKHGRVRWKATLVPVDSKVPGLDGFFFGNEDDKTRFLESGEATLDRNGKLALTIPLDPKLLTGLYGVRISATVLDIDGEPATEVQTYNPRPKQLVGVSFHPKQVQAGYSSPLSVIVVDRDGKKLNAGKIRADIMREEHFYIRKRDKNGNINYLWQEGWMKSLSTQQTIVNGQAVFQMDLNESGNYLIAFTYEDQTGRYSSQTLFKVGWKSYDEWRDRRDRKDVRTSNEMLLSMNKKEYAVGETVAVQFNTPRPLKKCLVTFERGKIFEYRVIDMSQGKSGFSFTMKEEYLPNVFVSVIGACGREGFPVYSSQTDSDIPMLYFGYSDIAGTSASQRLVLKIAPGISELKGKPAEMKKLSFKVTDQHGKGAKAEMAVCVVDEAVLALTRFRTPSLSSLTRFNLPLSVFSGDLRLGLVSQDLYRILTTKLLTGGDGGAGLVSPSLRKDFKPVAYYNPVVITDDSGQATVEFKLPDSTTAYRVYAVVCNKDSGFVSGQRNMVVTKEFFAEPSVPRFLIPGDHVTFPIVLHNKTKDKGEFSLVSDSARAFEVTLAKTSGTLEPWASSVVKATADVLSGMEEGRLRFNGTFTTQSAKYADAIEVRVPILSRYLPIFRSQMGSFKGSKKVTAKFPAFLKSFRSDDLNPADFKAHLMLSTTNWSKIAPGLKYLLRYPYGCIEQTSSGVIPLGWLRGLVKSGNIPGITEPRVDKFLKRGVERLLSMQTTSGGFAYWPGETNPSWWGTMYATFALITAKEGGYAVPEARLKGALDYLRKNLLEVGKDKYHGGAWTKELALFNLAMANRLNEQELAPFFDTYDSVGEQSKALLLLAAKRIGYLSEKELVSRLRKLSPRVDPQRTDYNDSSYREIAVCLLATLEIGGAREQANQWAGYLMSGLKPQGRWYSTADTGWCLYALSRYFEKKDTDSQETFTVKIDYGGDKTEQVNVSDAAAYIQMDPMKLLANGKVSLKTDSKRLVNYTLDLTYPDMAMDPTQLSNGFTIRKKMENLNGKEEIRVGDVIKVTLEIDLRGSTRRYWSQKFEYVALVDPVPAGMVPINSELKSEGVEEERSESDYDRYRNFTPTYFEFRDDGVRVFKNRAWGGRYQYTYLARAVAEGDFWMRASRISLMYSPEIFGRTKGKKVTILPAQ
jgi:uncharacterized protein YfaS (alpha-2-macroglobulin family)